MPLAPNIPPLVTLPELPSLSDVNPFRGDDPEKVRRTLEKPHPKATARGKVVPTPATHPARSKGSSTPSTGVAEPLVPTVKAPSVADAEASIGSFDDRVSLEIIDRDGNVLQVVICEDYDVDIGVFSQPAAFVIRLGHSGVLAQLMAVAIPYRKFRLKVGDVICQTGYIDGYECGGEAATLTIRGRDTLQDIHDSYTPVERTFTEKNHIDFIKSIYEIAALEVLEPRVADDVLRKAMGLGKPLPALPKAVSEERKITKPIKMGLGDRYYDVIKRVLDRAGLFLMAAPDGSLVLTTPNKYIEPLYRLVHAPIDVAVHGSVTDYHLRYETADRVALYVVYARGGGKKMGRVKHIGQYPDAEMAELGYKRTHTFRDWHLQSDEQATLMARRRIAEERRKSWQLNVTVAGHRTKQLGTKDWIVWRPDTMVRFDSDQLNIHDVLYIENVHFRRGGNGTTTELRLLRRDDLVFGYEELPEE